FLPSNPNVQWDLNSTAPPDSPPDYYVQFVNSSEVTLTPIGTGPLITAVLIGGNTLTILGGESAGLSMTAPPTCSTCETLSFSRSGFTFFPVNTWSSTIISVRNLNTEQ